MVGSLEGKIVGSVLGTSEGSRVGTGLGPNVGACDGKPLHHPQVRLQFMVINGKKLFVGEYVQNPLTCQARQLFSSRRSSQGNPVSE